MTARWLSLTEAAKWVQAEFERAGKTISRKTVSRWARDGRVRAEQREQRWYVDASSLEAHVRRLLADGSTTPPPATDSEDDAKRFRALRDFVRARNRRFLRDLEKGID